MSKSSPDQAQSRGARRRQALQEQKQHEEALRFWSKPGVLVFMAAFALAAVGGVLVVQDSLRIPVRQAEIDGLSLELERARWILDQMDHGENFQKPSVMMPDMPEWGKQRVTLDISFSNTSDRSRSSRVTRCATTTERSASTICGPTSSAASTACRECAIGSWRCRSHRGGRCGSTTTDSTWNITSA